MSARNGRPGYPEIDHLREDVIRDYEGGYGLKRIGAKYGFPWPVVRRRLLSWGVKLRRPGRPAVLWKRAELGRYRRILHLEEAISDKQEVVDQREVELKLAQEEAPQEAAAVVVMLKKAVQERRDFEEELKMLKEVA